MLFYGVATKAGQTHEVTAVEGSWSCSCGSGWPSANPVKAAQSHFSGCSF